MSKNVGPRRGPQAPDPGWLPEVFGYKCFPRPRGPEHKRVRCPEACGTGCQRWRRGQEEVQTWVPVTQTREAEGLVVTAQVRRAPDRPAGCPSLGTTRHTHTPNPRVAAPPAVPPTPRRPPGDACSLAGAAPALGVGVEGSGRGRARLSDRGIWGSEGPVGGQPLGDPPTSGSRVRSRACPGQVGAAGYTVVSFLQGPVRMLPVLSAPYGTAPWSSPFWPGPPEGRDCVLRSISKWARPRAGRGGQP